MNLHEFFLILELWGIPMVLIIVFALYFMRLFFGKKEGADVVSAQQINQKSSAKIMNLVLILPFFMLYVGISGFSAMMFDSCGSSGENVEMCSTMSSVYFLGVVFLIFSFMFGVVYKAFAPLKFKNITSKNRWMLLFLPSVALPIFVISLAFSGALFEV